MNLNRTINPKIESKLYIVAVFGLIAFCATALLISFFINKEVAMCYVGLGLSVLIIPTRYHKKLVTNLITFPITIWLAFAIIVLSIYYNKKSNKLYLPKVFFYSTQFDDYDATITSKK